MFNTQTTTAEEKLLTDAYTMYEKNLNKHSFFKIHNSTLSEDLVQDTFIKTWSYMVKEGKIDTMKSFLYHILNALIIDEYRKKKPVSLDMLIESGFEPSGTDTERFINTLDGKSALMLTKFLPLKYKRVIQMRFEKDLSLKEISHLTGDSKNTIAVQIHRGLDKLKVLYTK